MVNAGLIAAIAMFLYSVIMLITSFTLKYTTTFGPGPGFFPIWINGILLLLSGLYIWEAIKKDVIRWKEVAPPKESRMRMLSLLLGLVFFALTAEFLGFVVSGTVLLFLMFIWDYPWWKALLLSLLFVGVLAVVFNMLLRVSLPVNAWGF